MHLLETISVLVSIYSTWMRRLFFFGQQLKVCSIDALSDFGYIVKDQFIVGFDVFMGSVFISSNKISKSIA